MTIEIPVLLLYFFGAVIGVIVLLLAVIGIASLRGRSKPALAQRVVSCYVPKT